MVTDYAQEQLKLINPDGFLKSTIKIEEMPADVTAVDENCVAVSCREARAVSVNGKRDIGIYRDGSRTEICNTGIKRLNIDTGAIDKVVNDKGVDYGSHVVTGNERICNTCPETGSVTILNQHYYVMTRTSGLTVDNNINVYVTGYHSYNVLAISPDGQTHQLLSKEDGLSYPQGIHYDRLTKRLLVIPDAYSSTVCKYLLG